MPLDRIGSVLERHVQELTERGTAKGKEHVVTAVFPPEADHGPRVMLAGEGERRFLRMNSNSYLGMSLRQEVIEAEEKAARRYGTGPGAVRFISGTYAPHVDLERKLAAFHRRERAMIFSSAYASVVSTLLPLTTAETIIISDELNHNCIINGMRLARPLDKAIYPHLDLVALEKELDKAAGRAQRVLVVTDGIFSMRGDHAPLDEIAELVGRYDERFAENALLIVDDSHGVGAFGETGRGTEEHTGGQAADVLVATLGKALGINGGYVASSVQVIHYLRETSPLYIYSNPITPAEAHAALTALDILDSERGRELLAQMRRLTRRFEQGLVDLGCEIIPGEHPVVPLMVRDTARTRALVDHLFANGVLATGLTFPVVPKGDEEIRFQVNADHTYADIDEVLRVLAAF